MACPGSSASTVPSTALDFLQGNAASKFANAAAKWGEWAFVVDFSTTKLDNPATGGFAIPAGVRALGQSLVDGLPFPLGALSVPQLAAEGQGIYEIGINKPKVRCLPLGRVCPVSPTSLLSADQPHGGP